MLKASGITIILLTALCAGVHAGELQTFTGVTCVEKPSNDGDSFTVKIPSRKEEYVVRLCFVDCPETTAGTDADAVRLREQMRYFGLPGARETVELGKSRNEGFICGILIMLNGKCGVWNDTR